MDLDELQRAVFATHTEGAYQQALELLDDAELRLAGEHEGSWSRSDWSAALEAGWALALAQSSQPAGSDAFIAQAPSFGSISVDPDAVDHHPRQRQLEGVVLVGTADHAYDDATTMAAALERRIGRCDLEVVDGLGHDAPADLPGRLHRWLAAWHPHR